MENLVTINLEYYNYLRDFEKAIKEGKIASTVSRSFIFNDSKHVQFFTQEEIVKELTYSVDEIRSEAYEIQRKHFDEIEMLNREVQLKKELLSIISKMSSLQFRKWRKTYGNE